MNRQTARYTATISTLATRRPTEAEIAAGSSRYVRKPNGSLIGDVDVEVDLSALAEMLGPRAIRSAGKKAVEAGGLVTVRARNVRREP